MEYANSAVCFAESDDEDYVSFDEQELNTGIADLYDDDSASDAASDASAPEINFDELVMEENEEEEEVQKNEKEKESVSKLTFNLFGGKKKKKKDQKEKKNKNKNKKSSVISKGRKKKRSSSPKIEAQSAYAPRSARSAMQRQSLISDDDDDSDDDEIYTKKSKIATKLNKRINRLQGLQQKQERAKKKKKKVVFKQKVNTNVISIDLGTLASAADNVSTGDAYSCKSCKSIFSSHDELLKSYDDIKLDDEDDESIWICKFCNHINIIEIDQEEMPKNQTVDYILAPPDDTKQNELEKQSDEQQQIIFCIDVSGSMCVTTPVDAKKGIKLKLKGNRLKEEEDALSQFIDPMNRNQWMPNQNQNVSYISRLQCVQSAVDEQIKNIKKTNPNYKIGLVSFNNDVTVIGDGMMKQHKIITGDKLNNLEKLKEIGLSDECKISNNIGTAHEKLSDSLWNLKETGQTALGPALVISIAMASAKSGSQVILCTDGLANIGVGSLEPVPKNNDMIEAEADEEEDDDDPILKWYESLGDYAMSKGVIVNIISITDDGCKLENLGKLVEATNGNLKRINPLQLTEKFSGIIENQIIATNCQSTMLLHPGLKFYDTTKNVKIDEESAAAVVVEKKASKKKAVANDDDAPYPTPKKAENENEDDTKMNDKNDADDENKGGKDESDKMNEGRSIYKISRSLQDVGNVFAETRVFFEYVLNKEKVSEFKLLKKLPFQVQICYHKKDGSKMMRVITQLKDVTFDKKAVRKNLNMDILAKYGTKVTTELCAKGDYESSRAWTSANTQFMNRNISYGNKKQLLTLANYANDNVVLDHKMKKQQMVEMEEELLDLSMNDNYNNNNNFRSISSLQSRSAAAAPPPPPSASSSSSRFKGKSKKSKMKKRKNARNDQFSNYMYNMKKKSHK